MSDDNDFTPYQPPKLVTNAEKQSAIEFLKPLEKHMSYDAVRGWFHLRDIDSTAEFPAVNALKKLGGYGTSSSSFNGKSSITTVWEKESAEVAETLKVAGFNFPGAKDVPSSQKGF